LKRINNTIYYSEISLSKLIIILNKNVVKKNENIANLIYLNPPLNNQENRNESE